MTLESLRPELRWAIEAAQDKKAVGVTVLHLAGLGGFAEDFILCTGLSGPQIEAIGDSIEERLKSRGLRPEHREGRFGSEWLLLDYSRFVVHIFSERARLYYDLERLWRAAPRLDVPDDISSPQAGEETGPGQAAPSPGAHGGST